MSIYTNIARRVNGLLRRAGYKIVRAQSDFSLSAAFSRLTQRAIPITTVIDIGASNGSWSAMLYPFYPKALYFLIEANTIHQKALEDFKRANPSVDYIIAAAGDNEGEIFFDDRVALGGVASQTFHEGYTRVLVTTIDALVRQHQLHPPFLIKLDTHGFELPILNGAKETLSHTTILVIETYNFQLNAGALRFHEMCGFLATIGFRPTDMVDPLHRPYDQALWQFDLIFVRADRPEFKYASYE